MTESSNRSQPDVVGAEYGGKWIAWDDDDLHIVASGESYETVKLAAEASGVAEPILEYVPHSDAMFIGGV